jgi:GNAT superfamily N-acetyltransferase
MGALEDTLSEIGPPEPLSRRHDVAAFRCAHPDLNDWLERRALASDGKSARTYVVCAGKRVVGYYCLAAGSVIRAELPSARPRQNMPDPVPVIVLGRLAVDQGVAGRGLGKALLADAIRRTLGAAAATGARALVAHAIDDEAAGFYRRFGFIPSPIAARALIPPIEMAAQGAG